MKIDGWSIDGFGVWRDYEMRDLPAGLSVILGPNEAGKSTLLAFIRGALFGFARPGEYPPLRGGRHGGRLLLDFDGRRLTLDRWGGRDGGVNITEADGQEISESEVRRLMGFADERLFKSVFAFSLYELSEMQTLTAEGVRQQILSAGITGAGKSAQRILAVIDKEADGLLSERSGRIRDLVGQLDNLDQRIHQARAEAQRHGNWLAEEEELRKRLAELAARQEEISRSRSRMENMLALWPAHNQLDGARTQLSALEAVEDFPEQAQERLASAQSRIGFLSRQVEEADADLQARQQLRTDLESRLSEPLSARAQRIADLMDELPLHRQRAAALESLREETSRRREACDASVALLGPDWDRGRLAGFDASAARLQQARELDKRLTSGRDKLASAQAAHERADEQLQGLITQRDRLAAGINAETEKLLPMKEIAARRATIRRARQTLTTTDKARAKTQLEESALHDLEATRAALPPSISGQWPMIGGVCALVLALAMLVATEWRLKDNHITSAIIFLAAGVLSLVGGVGLIVLAVGRFRAAQARSVQSAALDAEVEKRRSAAEGSGQELKRLGETFAEDCRAAGVSSDTSLADLDQADDALQEQRLAWATAKKWHEDLQHIRADVAVAEQRLAAAGEQLTAAKAAAESDESAWASWAAGLGLGTSIAPQATVGLLQQVQAAQSLDADVRRSEEAMRQTSVQVAAWEDAARSLLVELNDASVAGDSGGQSLADALARLETRADIDRDARARLAELAADVAQIQGRQEVRQRELAAAQAELAKLFAEAGVRDEGELRRRQRIFEQRADLSATIAQLERQVEGQLGQGPAAEDTRQSLSTGRLEDWQSARDQSDRDLVELRRQRDAVVASLATASTARERLESSAELPSLELELESLKHELGVAVNHWRTTAMSGHLLREALVRYKAARQPAVLKIATKLFAEATSGRYVQVFQPDDAEDIRVADRDGKVKNPQNLSRGAAEQLYLCLRLGLASEFARRNSRLPLVMDDVLVNFDPGRAKAVAQLLGEMAQQHQVLLFTCHPSTAQLLRESAGATQLDLPVVAAE